MNKEELKQEAEVCMHNVLFWLKLPINKENVEQGGSYVLKLLEPREKRIVDLENQVRFMGMQIDNLKAICRTDNTETLNNALKRIEELEAQVEKMKCCENCKNYSPTYGLCCYSLGDEDYDCRLRRWEMK